MILLAFTILMTQKNQMYLYTLNKYQPWKSWILLHVLNIKEGQMFHWSANWMMTKTASWKAGLPLLEHIQEDDVFKLFFLNKSCALIQISQGQMICSNYFSLNQSCDLIQMSLVFVSKGPVGNKSILVKVMVKHWAGGKPLPEPLWPIQIISHGIPVAETLHHYKILYTPTRDLSHKSSIISDGYPTMHHFVTEMCVVKHVLLLC